VPLEPQEPEGLQGTSPMYRGTSLTKTSALLGPYSRTMHKALHVWWVLRGWAFLMSEVPLQASPEWLYTVTSTRCIMGLVPRRLRQGPSEGARGCQVQRLGAECVWVSVNRIKKKGQPENREGPDVRIESYPFTPTC